MYIEWTKLIQIDTLFGYIDISKGNFIVSTGIFLGTSQLAYRRQKLGRSPSPARWVREHAPPGNF